MYLFTAEVFVLSHSWGRLPFPIPGDLPYPGMKPCLLHWQTGSLLPASPGKPTLPTSLPYSAKRN